MEPGMAIGLAHNPPLLGAPETKGRRPIRVRMATSFTANHSLHYHINLFEVVLSSVLALELTSDQIERTVVLCTTIIHKDNGKQWLINYEK